MNGKIEKIIGRIRKLFAIAADKGATSHESQSAINMANSLMDKFHLSEEDIGESVDSASIGMARFHAYVGPAVYTWESMLGGFISEFTHVPVYIDARKNRAVSATGSLRYKQGKPWDGKSFVFYGVAEDAIIAAMLYESLHDMISANAVLRYGKAYKGNGALYAQGFVDGLHDQLMNARAANAKLSDESPLTLIIQREGIIRRKQEMAKEWLRRQGETLINRAHSRGASGDLHAYAKGVHDGKQTNVSADRRKKLK